MQPIQCVAKIDVYVEHLLADSAHIGKMNVEMEVGVEKQ
ncbi:hypothetical protein C627_13710 [Corynebacterium glutamicum ZL-6]|nr:hypothetical protein C627_13710 [Corynebacterium glutamicum ZL-6]